MGNKDQNTVVSHDLYPPIIARYVRFRPIEWSVWVSMRVELYGCQGTTTTLKFNRASIANTGRINYLTGHEKILTFKIKHFLNIFWYKELS